MEDWRGERGVAGAGGGGGATVIAASASASASVGGGSGSEVLSGRSSIGHSNDFRIDGGIESVRAALRDRHVVVEGGSFTAEAFESQDRFRFLDQLRHARRLRAVMDAGVSRAGEAAQLAMRQHECPEASAVAAAEAAKEVLLSLEPHIRELVHLTNAVRGGFVLDSYQDHIETPHHPHHPPTQSTEHHNRDGEGSAGMQPNHSNQTTQGLLHGLPPPSQQQQQQQRQKRSWNLLRNHLKEMAREREPHLFPDEQLPDPPNLDPQCQQNHQQKTNHPIHGDDKALDHTNNNTNNNIISPKGPPHRRSTRTRSPTPSTPITPDDQQPINTHGDPNMDLDDDPSAHVDADYDYPAKLISTAIKKKRRSNPLSSSRRLPTQNSEPTLSNYTYKSTYNKRTATRNLDNTQQDTNTNTNDPAHRPKQKKIHSSSSSSPTNNNTTNNNTVTTTTNNSKKKIPMSKRNLKPADVGLSAPSLPLPNSSNEAPIHAQASANSKVDTSADENTHKKRSIIPKTIINQPNDDDDLATNSSINTNNNSNKFKKKRKPKKRRRIGLALDDDDADFEDDDIDDASEEDHLKHLDFTSSSAKSPDAPTPASSNSTIIPSTPTERKKKTDVKEDDKEEKSPPSRRRYHATGILDEEDDDNDNDNHGDDGHDDNDRDEDGAKNSKTKRGKPSDRSTHDSKQGKKEGSKTIQADDSEDSFGKISPPPPQDVSDINNDTNERRDDSLPHANSTSVASNNDVKSDDATVDPVKSSSSVTIVPATPSRKTSKPRSNNNPNRKCHECKKSVLQWRRCHFWFENGTKCRKTYCVNCLVTNYGFIIQPDNNNPGDKETAKNHDTNTSNDNDHDQEANNSVSVDSCVNDAAASGKAALAALLSIEKRTIKSLDEDDEDWHCPSCLGICQCKICSRARGRGAGSGGHVTRSSTASDRRVTRYSY